MVSAVLEPDVAVEQEEATATRRGEDRTLAHGASAPTRGVLARCSLCGGTHPPRDDNDPPCPVEGF